MRASMAIGLVYGKKIQLGNDYFLDGPNSSGVELYIEKALEL